jgi:hypothetical protein
VPHAYTEDQLVEQPAIGLFAALGWQTLSAMDETFGPSGTLERETKGEVVLAPHLRAALVQLNSALPPEAITAAVDELTRDRSAMSVEAANREVYLLLKEGIKVSRYPTASTAVRRPSACASWTGGSRRTTTSCSSASSASRVRSTRAGRTWSSSSSTPWTRSG